jgi:ribonuclease J
MSVKFSILGGSGEIGMNMYLYETQDTAVIIDCGVMFSDSTLPGVDLIIPDFEYLNTIKDKLKAVILTHGHEDHIGGIPYLLKDFDLEIYTGLLTAELVKVKSKEHKIKPKINTFFDGDEFFIGDFKFKSLLINHSISDTYAICIFHKDCNFLHISDFKIDNTPVSGKAFDTNVFSQLADTYGFDCLISDSTNVINSGYTASESSVKNDIKELIENHDSRVFFTTFASNIDRIQQVIEICNEVGRKIIFDGRSILKNIQIASSLNYLKIPRGVVISISEIKNYPDDKLCFIISGCQGERQSTLFKIVSKERKKLRIQKGDLFIISARVIPGNEKNLNETINNIYINGGEVVDIEKNNIHVSGHASEEEVKLLLKLTKPKYLIPVHGEYFHLKKHISLAIDNGLISEDRAIFTITGQQLLFENKDFVSKLEIPYGRTYIDRRGNFLFGEELLKIRKNLSRDGIVIIKLFIDEFNQLQSPPEIYTEGFNLNDNQLFLLRKFIMDSLPVLNDEIKNDINNIKNLVNKLTKTYFKKRLDRRPVILVIDVII